MDTQQTFFSSDLIYLRAAEPEDLEIIYKWENNSEIWEVSNTLTPLSHFTLKLYLERAGQDIYETKQLRLMIVRQEDNQVVGAIDLFDYEPIHQRIGLGLYIEKQYQNKHYGTESISLVLEYAFKHLLLHQVYCHISSKNKISIKLFSKLGFLINGEKKDWTKTLDGYENELILQCINPYEK